MAYFVVSVFEWLKGRINGIFSGEGFSVAVRTNTWHNLW